MTARRESAIHHLTTVSLVRETWATLRRPSRNWSEARKGEIPRHGMACGNFYSLRDQSPTLARNDNPRMIFLVIPSPSHPRLPHLALHAARQAPREISPSAPAHPPDELRNGLLSGMVDLQEEVARMAWRKVTRASLREELVAMASRQGTNRRELCRRRDGYGSAIICLACARSSRAAKVRASRNPRISRCH